MTKEEILEKVEDILNESYDSHYDTDNIENVRKQLMELWKQLMNDIYSTKKED